jgi:hypothetical protein
MAPLVTFQCDCATYGTQTTQEGKASGEWSRQHCNSQWQCAAQRAPLHTGVHCLKGVSQASIGVPIMGPLLMNHTNVDALRFHAQGRPAALSCLSYQDWAAWYCMPTVTVVVVTHTGCHPIPRDVHSLAES